LEMRNSELTTRDRKQRSEISSWLLVAGGWPANQANYSRQEKMKNCSMPNKSVNAFLSTTSNLLSNCLRRPFGACVVVCPVSRGSLRSPRATSETALPGLLKLCTSFGAITNFYGAVSNRKIVLLWDFEF